MNLAKRLTALLLAMLLVTGLFPAPVLAAEQEPLTFEATYINPLYADIVSEEDLPPVVTPKVQTYETVHYVTTVEDAGLVLREQMKARMEAPVVHIFANVSTQEGFKALCEDIYQTAIAHTKTPDEGDYILWHFSGYEAGGKLYSATGGYNIDITYSMAYHSNAEQEAAVDAAVEELLDQLNLSGKSDYEKVKTVYDYICANITYDHTSSGTLKHTTYAALIKKTAVCQGYASLLYRLLLELGIDNRVIAGSTSSGDHGWNIVELDGLYYNADSTWDAGETNYTYFLRSMDQFPNHYRFAEYTTSAFNSAYPMAAVDYVPPAHTHSHTAVVTPPTCTEDGYTTYTCDCGDSYVDDYVDATGHTFGTWYETNEPTEDEVGEERRDCANCDVYETREVEKLEPSEPSGTCGENLTWVFDEETGTLTISGTGAMAHFYDAVQPWEEENNKIITVIVEEGVESLGTYSFFECEKMTDLELPSTLSSISENSLPTVGSLVSINVASNNPNYCSDSGVLYNKEKQALMKYPAKKLAETYTISNTVTVIAFTAFAECSNLNMLIFQGNAPFIDETSFANTTLTAQYPAHDSTWTEEIMQDYGGDITWVAYGDEPATSGTCGDNLTWVFNEESGKLSVSGSGDMYGADKLGWTVFADDIRSVEIGNGTTSVGAYAFSDCTNLADVQMPDTVMNIAYNAFENCSSLTAVDIPDNVMEIAYGAFMDCSALTAVDIPDSVMEISYSAFKDCTSLASVELPRNVMAISYHAFDNCTSLSEVEFPTSLASISTDAFRDCTGLDEMHFTGNAPTIQNNAFYNVTSDAYYPAANATWTSDVLQNYGGALTWIAEGGTVTPDNSCGENITWEFEASTGTLTISGKETMARSNGNSIMDDYARPEDTPWYAYQDQIITIIIEGTVDSVGKNAFSGCTNLTTVIIEAGVSEIDSTAFSDCESLENCYYEGTEEQWEALGTSVGEATVHTESAEPESHTETKTTVAPTCTEQGYDLYTCSCGTNRKDNFTDPTGHSYTAVVTDPTCTDKGYTTYTCSCGDIYTGNEIAALGHSWNDGVVTKEPTATEPGVKTYICTVCEETETEEIPYMGENNSVQRISGKDRVKTALSVANALKDTLKVEKFNAVIIATGMNEKFADALAGSYLANVKGAPILLYNGGSSLSALNVTFIRENLKTDGTVYILGGTGAIPATVEDALAGYSVQRLSGKDRYLTNLAILNEAGVSGANEILIATGTNFADSLSASAVGLPLLLVNGKGNTLTAEQTEFLKGMAGKKVTIIGGTGAVSEKVEAAIEAAVGVEATRISGKSRHNTSVMIAQKYFKAPEYALLTYAQNFPDGLAGGPLAYAMGAPLLLTNAGQESIANEYIVAEDIENGYVLGGDAAVSDATARKVFGLAANTAIEKAYYTE